MRSGKEQPLRRFGRYGIEPYNWVVGRKLMASVYPVDHEYLEFLRDMEGVRLCINLSEDPWPADWTARTGIESLHFPVEDMTIPEVSQVREIILAIDAHDGPVMVHCTAGLGRTGTVLALYLTEHGMEPVMAIALVREKRSGAIQTIPQEMMVMEWERIKGGQ